MSFFRGLTRNQVEARKKSGVISRSVAYTYSDDPREMFNILMAYYEQNGLYDALYAMLLAIGHQGEALKGLRNPANRVVEFYAAKLWPGQLPMALPIVTANEKIVDPIHEIWRWSNWGAQKQVFARWLPIFGNTFIKIVATEKTVFFKLIDPRNVPEFDLDDRGIITRARFDIPIRGGLTHTELWTEGGVGIWKHTQGYGAEIDRLGNPSEVKTMEEMKIDFIPIVQVKHRDVGGPLGAGAYQLSLDKIDEANRQASRLYRMLFKHNKNTWALKANMTDPAGRPVPAPKINNDGSDTLELDDDSVVRLPGNSSLESMIPQINYADALAVLVDFLRELEQDLPEMAYYRIYEAKGDLSGRALRLMLTAAIDRVYEARGNAETGLARADSMALTIGQNNGLWSELGSYEDGDFVHTFANRPIIPLTETERSEIVRNLTQAQLPASSSLRFAGYSDEEIEQAVEEIAEAKAAEQVSLGLALARAQREFNQETE